MPIKDPEKRKQAQRDAMTKKRGSQRVHTSEGSQEIKPKQVNPIEAPKLHHPILYALTDPVKREKLQRIHDSLRPIDRKEIYWGFGMNVMTMGEVGDLLFTTEGCIKR